MGSRYLTDLMNVAKSVGVNVFACDGWENNARSSGGFDGGQPSFIVCHHTASNAGSDGWSDANYIAHGADIAPISQLYINRAGDIWVCAAGACNNAGSGGPLGSCPVDGMNTRSIALEVANNGVGEVWPERQQDTYVSLVAALSAHYGIPNSNIVAHFEWAPDRKIDPAGQSRYASGSNKWDMNKFRADVQGGGQPPQEDDMTPEQAKQLAELHNFLIVNGGNPGFVDPAGNPANVPWILWYCYQAVLVIDGRVQALEAKP